jgi:hypothetical protein
MSAINNSLEIAFKKALDERHKKKKALIADVLLHKKHSNTIKLSEKNHEDKASTSNERVRESNNDNGVGRRSKTPGV